MQGFTRVHGIINIQVNITNNPNIGYIKENERDIKKLIMVNNKITVGLFFSFTILFNACNNGNKSQDSNIPAAAPKYSNNKDSINGKPIVFYLKNKNCSGIAKNYYYRKFIPSDNDSTVELLDLSISEDTLLRPFYFWCLNKIVGEADGALMEYVGVPARRYIEKYPAEFFKNINSRSYKGNRNNWLSAVNYSGYYEDENANNQKKIAKKFISTIKKNCKNCSKSTLEELTKFANECFGE